MPGRKQDVLISCVNFLFFKNLVIRMCYRNAWCLPCIPLWWTTLSSCGQSASSWALPISRTWTSTPSSEIIVYTVYVRYLNPTCLSGCSGCVKKTLAHTQNWLQTMKNKSPLFSFCIYTNPGALLLFVVMH